jgi:hypothetical protein
MLAAGVSATTGHRSSTQRHGRNWLRGNHASQTLDPRATGHLKNCHETRSWSNDSVYVAIASSIRPMSPPKRPDCSGPQAVPYRFVRRDAAYLHDRSFPLEVEPMSSRTRLAHAVSSRCVLSASIHAASCPIGTRNGHRRRSRQWRLRPALGMPGGVGALRTTLPDYGPATRKLTKCSATDAGTCRWRPSRAGGRGRGCRTARPRWLTPH